MTASDDLWGPHLAAEPEGDGARPGVVELPTPLTVSVEGRSRVRYRFLDHAGRDVARAEPQGERWWWLTVGRTEAMARITGAEPVLLDLWERPAATMRRRPGSLLRLAMDHADEVWMLDIARTGLGRSRLSRRGVPCLEVVPQARGAIVDHDGSLSGAAVVFVSVQALHVAGPPGRRSALAATAAALTPMG